MPGDVDTATAALTAGQVLVWNNGASKFEPGDKFFSILELTDMDDSTFTGKGEYLIQVKSDASGVELVDPSTVVFGSTNRITIDGDGSTTTHALGFTATEANSTVYVGGVIQDVYDGSDGSYNISGTNITFQSAMPTGTQAVVISTSTASVQHLVSDNLDNSQDFAVNTNDFVVDVTNGRVGIGTASPSQALDVVGNIHASGNIVAGGNIELGDADSDTVTFNADVASDIIPSASNTHDLGSSTAVCVVHATNLHGSLADVSDFVHFHSADQVISLTQATNNASGTIDLTFTDLATALTYQIFLNRTLMRPTDEYSVSGSTVTIVQGVLDENDEIEVVGLKHANA